MFKLLKKHSSEAEAARSEGPEGVLFLYVEGSERLRTKLEGFFSNLLWRIPIPQV